LFLEVVHPQVPVKVLVGVNLAIPQAQVFETMLFAILCMYCIMHSFEKF